MPKYGVPLNMGQDQILNAVIHKLSTAPSSPVEAQIYYNTVDKILYYYNGTTWISTQSGAPTGSAGGALTGTYPNPSLADNAVTTSKITDGNVTIAKIGSSTFDTQVRTSRLDQMATPTGPLSVNGQRITNVATPTSANDGVNKSYADQIAAGLTDFKNSARVSTTSNGTFSTAFANGQTVDGITLATGDRILIKNQTTASQNGIYTVNASGSPSRAADADANGELSVGTLVYVESGTTNGAQQWVCTATGSTPWVPDTDSSTWALFFAVTAAQAGAGLTASGNVLAVGAGTGITVAADAVSVDTTIVSRYKTFTIGDGSATQFDLAHNLGNQWVTLEVINASSPFDRQVADYQCTDANNVRVLFTTAPASNAYKVAVRG